MQHIPFENLDVLLGQGIDLDPASCALANTVVRAGVFFSPEKHVDGLRLPWFGRVFCNPPGGKTESGKSIVKAWWEHGVAEWMRGRVSAMIWIAFKLDFLQTTQECDGPSMLDFPICYPSKRLAYLSPTLPGPTAKNPDRKPTRKQILDHEMTGLCSSMSPPHASAIVLLPGGDPLFEVIDFMAAFSDIGTVVFDEDRLPKRGAA